MMIETLRSERRRRQNGFPKDDEIAKQTENTAILAPSNERTERTPAKMSWNKKLKLQLNQLRDHRQRGNR